MNESTEATLSLDVAASPAAPSVARRFAAEALRALSVPEEVVAEARLAVSEVVSQAVELGETGMIRVVVDGADPISLVLPPLPRTTEEDPIDRRRILAGLSRLHVEHLDGRTVLSLEDR